MVVSLLKTSDLSILLCESFDDANTWYGVGQDIDHLGPSRASTSKSCSHASLNPSDDPSDEGEWEQADESHGWIEPNEQSRRDDDHNDVRHEIDRMDR